MAALVAVPADHDLLPMAMVAMADHSPADQGGARLALAIVPETVPLMALSFPVAAGLDFNIASG